MPRKLDDRVETLFPVFDKAIIRIVKTHLDLILSDNVKAWEMSAEASYSKINNEDPKVNSQTLFLTRLDQKKNVMSP